MKKYIIAFSMCCLAALSWAVTRSALYLESSGGGILQAPEAAELVIGIAMLSPAFGYLLVKRKK